MLQSSITAWLKKPAAVKQAAAAPANNSFQEPTVLPSPSKGPLISHETSLPPTQSRDVCPEEPKIWNAFALPPLPANVEFVQLTEDLMPSFKRIHSLTLPVPYPKIYYTESMTEPYHGLTLLALWHPTPQNSLFPDAEKPHLVGAIRCRLLPSSILYLSTLCVLAPYRSHGIATHLLQKISAKAANEHQVKSVAAHVWEANDDGLEWYKKRGFDIMGKEDRYYSKLKPAGAVLMQRVIGVGDLLGTEQQSNTNQG